MILFSFTSVFVNAQQYFVNEYAYYLLEDSVHFTFGQTGFCGSAPSGKGTYKKEGNKITFQFSPSIPREKKSNIIYVNTDTSQYYSTIDIICLEDSVNTLPYANIFYTDKNKINTGTSTDLDGKAQLRILKTEEVDTLSFRYVGVSNVDLPIKNVSQRIEIILPFESTFEIHDDVEVFRIGRKNKLLPIED